MGQQAKTEYANIGPQQLKVKIIPIWAYWQTPAPYFGAPNTRVGNSFHKTNPLQIPVFVQYLDDKIPNG